MSGIEDRLYREAAEPRNEEARKIVEILREDGFDEMADRYDEEHWQRDEELQREIKSPVLADEIKYVQDRDVDYIQLAFDIHKALGSGRMKGLRNRARVWKDCNWILKDINRLKREGKLLEDGKISHDTWRELNNF